MISSFSQQLLQELASHKLPGIPLTEEMIAPYYDGLNISNLPASIANWLGVELQASSLLDSRVTRLLGGHYRQVILTVVDALGWELFQRFSKVDSAENERMAELFPLDRVFPLTSVVPSTTASALASFWTGLTPSSHGITGYEMWLQEYGITANMILQTPASFIYGSGSLAEAGFRPDHFLNVESFGTTLKKRGIQSYALQHESISRSGLSDSLLSDVQSMPFSNLSNLWQTLDQKLAEKSSEQRYFYVYWGDLDGFQHAYGPDDTRVAQAYFEFLRSMNNFLSLAQKRGNGDTLFLLTADHGQVPTSRPPRAEIKRYPDLLAMLHLLPTGESRLPYLYLKPGFEKQAFSRLEALFPGQFIPVDSQKAVDAGLFGPKPYHPQLISRLGDVVLLARDHYFLYWHDKENLMQGRHGGLNRKEMLVPLIALTL